MPSPLPPSETLTVLGLSKSGVAVARHGVSQHKAVFLSEMLPGSDSNRQQRKDLQALGVTIEMGGHSQQCFSHSHDVVVSPGIPPTSSVIQQLLLSEKNVMSEVEYAYRQHPNPTWIGVTGTNGKTTTVTGIQQVLQAALKTTTACGNIGLPVTDCLTEHADDAYWVVELSSFQLTFSPTVVPKIAVFLNLSPDHINWHGSFESYKAAKLSLYTPQLDGTAPAWIILNADDPVSAEIAAEASPQSTRVWFSRSGKLPEGAEYGVTLSPSGDVCIRWPNPELQTDALFNMADVTLLGAHNHDNLLAVIATSLVCDVPVEVIEKTCKDFSGVPHRLEPLPVINETTGASVQVVNDSKATNVTSTLAALKAFEGQPVVLLLGGRLKSEPLEPLFDAIQATATSVVVYGEVSARLPDKIRQSGFSGACLSAVALSDAIESALSEASQLSLQASKKAVLLFSPAAASFDQFADFEARGNAFKACIAEKAHLLSDEGATAC